MYPPCGGRVRASRRVAYTLGVLRPLISLFALFLAPALASAQSVHSHDAPTQRSAVNSKTVVAPHNYDSAFTGYRFYREEPVRPWHEVNQEVERLKGHAGHIRDDNRDDNRDNQPAAPSAPAVTNAPTAPAPRNEHRH